jgi:hypothetical protein
MEIVPLDDTLLVEGRIARGYRFMPEPRSVVKLSAYDPRSTARCMAGASRRLHHRRKGRQNERGETCSHGAPKEPPRDRRTALPIIPAWWRPSSPDPQSRC